MYEIMLHTVTEFATDSLHNAKKNLATVLTIENFMTLVKCYESKVWVKKKGPHSKIGC